MTDYHNLKVTHTIAGAVINYDMDLEEVQRIYDEFWGLDKFYDELELFIKNRRDKE